MESSSAFAASDTPCVARVDIVGSRTSKDPGLLGREYTVYELRVFSHDGLEWPMVTKRYTHFHKLHGDIKERMGPRANLLPSLPPKIRGQGADPAVVRARRAQLCSYINQLLQVIPSRSRPLLDEFLNLGQPPIPLPQASSCVVPAADGQADPKCDDNLDDIAAAQRCAGECHGLVTELTQELRRAEVPDDVVHKVQSRAQALVELVEALAHDQHNVWEEALRAVCNRLSPWPPIHALASESSLEQSRAELTLVCYICRRCCCDCYTTLLQEKMHSLALEKSATMLALKTEEAASRRAGIPANAVEDTLLLVSDDENELPGYVK